MDEAAPPASTAAWRRWLPLALLAAAAAAFFALGLQHDLTLQALAAHRAALAAATARLGLAGPLAYALVYAAATTLALPIAILLTLTGGLLFGAAVGGIAALSGATCGATLFFLAARTGLGDWLKRRGGPRMAALEAGFAANAASYLLVLRLVPLFPFWLVNLVAALMRVRLGTFVLCSLFGMAPGAFVYAGIGAGLGEVLAAGRVPTLPNLFAPRLLLPLLGLAALALLPVFVKARAK